MFIAGKRSTGMRMTLTVPTSTMTRQITTMRYGVLIANRDILFCLSVGHLGLHLVAVLEAGVPAHDHLIAFLQTGTDFHALRRFHTDGHRHEMDHSRRLHDVNTSGGAGSL